jgi:amidohydrolase
LHARSVLRAVLNIAAVGCTAVSAAAAASLGSDIDRLAAAANDQVIAWRRDIHQHPELGNRETRTAALVAAELQ